MGLFSSLGSLKDCYVTLPNGKRALTVDDGNVGFDVSVQDQTTATVDRFLTQKLGTATLASPLNLDDRTITLDPGHGFVSGNMIEIESANGLKDFQADVISIAGDVLTVNNPINFPFTVDAIVQRVNPNMNILASAVSPVTFYACPPSGVKWDINLLSINILDNDTMGDGLFGGLPMLTNGVVFRTVNDEYINIFNARNNGCFRRHADIAEYADKPPAGLFGFHSVRYFNGQNGDGVARRLHGDDASCIAQFQAIIADDLTGLSAMFCVLRGHVVEE